MGGDKRRSLWAWGWADKEPTREDQDEIATLLEAMLDFPERPRLDPPDLDAVELDEPRIDAPETDAEVTASRRARMLHTFGKSYRDIQRNRQGVFDPAPDLVARPASEEDVASLIEWAARRDVAVIPFGGGTSVVGGVERGPDGYAGVLSLDLRGMDRVLDVDEGDRTARIQAGATGPQLNEQLAEHGLVLRHYPQSYEFSTLGGWIATRSGGHYATQRTRIDDFVQSVRLVAPSARLETLSVPSSGAGPDLSRLILGSEGVLGVVTEATMRVEPRARYRSRATLGFDDVSDAVAGVRAVVQSGLTPANLRLLDRTEAMMTRVADTHVVLVGFEAPGTPVEAQLDEAVALLEDAGGALAGEPTHRGPGEGRDEDGQQDRWRRSFLEVPYLLNTLATLGVVADTFETCTTWSRFPALNQAIRKRVGNALQDVGGQGVLSMRFTHVYPDGPAPYYTFIAPAEPGTELEAWQQIKQTASDTLREHGATITHHHAVGRTHRPWYEDETPAALRDALVQAKRVLDPAGVMNPGVLVDPA